MVSAAHSPCYRDQLTLPLPRFEPIKISPSTGPRYRCRSMAVPTAHFPCYRDQLTLPLPQFEPIKISPSQGLLYRCRSMTVSTAHFPCYRDQLNLLLPLFEQVNTWTPLRAHFTATGVCVPLQCTLVHRAHSPIPFLHTHTHTTPARNLQLALYSLTCLVAPLHPPTKAELAPTSRQPRAESPLCLLATHKPPKALSVKPPPPPR